jgi:hypothetical protein
MVTLTALWGNRSFKESLDRWTDGKPTTSREDARNEVMQKKIGMAL